MDGVACAVTGINRWTPVETHMQRLFVVSALDLDGLKAETVSAREVEVGWFQCGVPGKTMNFSADEGRM